MAQLKYKVGDRVLLNGNPAEVLEVDAADTEYPYMVRYTLQNTEWPDLDELSDAPAPPPAPVDPMVELNAMLIHFAKLTLDLETFEKDREELKKQIRALGAKLTQGGGK